MKLSEMVQTIQHIGIPTNKFDETIEFYQKLEFELVYSTGEADAANRVAFVQLGQIMMEVYEEADPEEKAGAIDHVSLNTTDIESTFKIVKDNGLKVIDDEIKSLPFWDNGIRYFTIEGPNSEKIEFNEIL